MIQPRTSAKEAPKEKPDVAVLETKSKAQTVFQKLGEVIAPMFLKEEWLLRELSWRNPDWLRELSLVEQERIRASYLRDAKNETRDIFNAFLRSSHMSDLRARAENLYERYISSQLLHAESAEGYFARESDVLHHDMLAYAAEFPKLYKGRYEPQAKESLEEVRATAVQRYQSFYEARVKNAIASKSFTLGPDFIVYAAREHDKGAIVDYATLEIAYTGTLKPYAIRLSVMMFQSSYELHDQFIEVLHKLPKKMQELFASRSFINGYLYDGGQIEGMKIGQRHHDYGGIQIELDVNAGDFTQDQIIESLHTLLPAIWPVPTPDTSKGTVK